MKTKIYKYNIYRIATAKSKLAITSSMAWFAMTPNYGGTTYGKIGAEFSLNRPIKLFNLGNLENRQQLIKLIERTVTNDNVKLILSPDEQYSGSAQNRTAHKLIKKALRASYDGTYICKANAPTTDELAGPSEIVLFSPRGLIKRVKYFEPIES